MDGGEVGESVQHSLSITNKSTIFPCQGSGAGLKSDVYTVSMPGVISILRDIEENETVRLSRDEISVI